jgi:hypothetical protein
MSGEYSCALKRLTISVALLVALAPLAGCSSGGVSSDSRVTVYVSVPMSGPDGDRGRAVAAGARAALAQAGGRAGELAVRAAYLDDARGAGRPALPAIAANARRATEDSTAIAYLGELDRSASSTSQAITGEAGILQVVPRGADERAGRRAMEAVLRAIREAGDSGDERGAVRDAYLER